MSTKHTRELDDTIRCLQHKTVGKAAPYDTPLWRTVPEAARAARNYAKQAPFTPYRYRRRGYILKVNPWPLSLLSDLPVQRVDWQRHEEHWLQGTYWTPLPMFVEWTGNRWDMVKLLDFGAAEFLASKEHDWILVQALEEDDPPADASRVNAFLEQGINLPDGRHAPVLEARVTL